MNYLIIVFHGSNNLSLTPVNFSIYFHDKLSSIYEQAFTLQRKHLGNYMTRRRLLSSENGNLNQHINLTVKYKV